MDTLGSQTTGQDFNYLFYKESSSFTDGWGTASFSHVPIETNFGQERDGGHCFIFFLLCDKVRSSIFISSLEQNFRKVSWAKISH